MGFARIVLPSLRLRDSDLGTPAGDGKSSFWLNRGQRSRLLSVSKVGIHIRPLFRRYNHVSNGTGISYAQNNTDGARLDPHRQLWDQY